MKTTVLIISFLVIALLTFAFLRGRKKQVWETNPGGPYTVIVTEDEKDTYHPGVHCFGGCTFSCRVQATH